MRSYKGMSFSKYHLGGHSVPIFWLRYIQFGSQLIKEKSLIRFVFPVTSQLGILP
jgi:hypothetical protein